MTEQEAKILASELESSKYWRVVSIGPEHPEQFTGKPCCTVRIEHATDRLKNMTVSGVYPVELVMQELHETGPEHADTW